MTPRKETLAEGVEIWLGDCREILPTLGNVDAVVTDPPYGISFVHSGKGGKLARSTQFGGVAVMRLGWLWCAPLGTHSCLMRWLCGCAAPSLSETQSGGRRMASRSP